MRNILILLASSLFLCSAQANAQTTCPQLPMHCVGLAWVPSASASVVSTQVFRNGALFAAVDPAVSVYADASVVQNLSYNYAVYAVDATGTRSAASNLVFAVIPPDSTTPPPPATATITMSGTPTALNFTGTVGGSIACQNLTIDDDGVGPLPIMLTTTLPWLTMTPATGNTKLISNVCVKTAGLAAGIQNGTLAIINSAPNPSNNTAKNSPLNIAVKLTLSAPATQTITTACPETTNATVNCAVKGMNHGQTLGLELKDSSGKIVSTSTVKRN